MMSTIHSASADIFATITINNSLLCVSVHQSKRTCVPPYNVHMHHATVARMDTCA